MDPLKIPDGHEDITPEWLSRVVCIPVVSCEATKIGEGVGFVGRILRIEIAYENGRGEGPRTLVVKLPAADRDLRERIWQIHEKEIRFYKNIADGMELRTPRCYYSAVDTENLKCVLLLEDLAPARPGDQLAGCSIEEAENVLFHLAQMHASYWENPRLRAIPDLPPFDARAERWQENYPQWWESFVEQFGHQIPKTVLPIGEQLKGKTLKIYRLLMNIPNTFVHGDFRLDNMFFYDNGSIAVIDWQGYAYGPASWDVTRFVVGSLDPEVRRDHEAGLLRFYHERLVDRGVEGYGYDQLTADFRLTLLDMWMFIVAVLVNFDMAVNERSRALVNRGLDRTCTALLDHRADEIIPS